MAGSPRRLHGGRVPLGTSWRQHRPCSPRRGWDRAWLGVVTFGSCCHPSHPPPRAVLGHPVLVVTAFLSPWGHSQAGEERGTQANRWGGTTGGGPPASPAVTVARRVVSPGCPHPGSGVSLAQEGTHPTEDHVVPHTGTRRPSCRDHGDLTGSCIERARRAWRGTGTPRPWRANGYDDTLPSCWPGAG